MLSVRDADEAEPTMLSALFAAALLTREPPDAVGRRIAQSSAAAEALQGSLDGSWTFRGPGRGRDVEIIDPPTRPAKFGGAWRDGHGGVGFVDLSRLSPNAIELTFTGEGWPPIRLVRAGDGAWRGEWNGKTVVLSRRLARG